MNILKRREEYTQNLRKEKLFNQLMEKRLGNRTFSENTDYSIKLDRLNIEENTLKLNESSVIFYEISLLMKNSN